MTKKKATTRPAEPKMTSLERAYRDAKIVPPPPPDLSSPAELLQCWQSLTRSDRERVLKFARLLTAEDLPESLCILLRDVHNYDYYEEHLIKCRARKDRERKSPGTKA